MRKGLLLVLSVLLMVSFTSCMKAEEKQEAAVAARTSQNAESKNKIDLALEEKRSKSGNEGSDIFAIKGTNGTDEGFERLVELMAGQGLEFYKTSKKPQGLIGKDDVVLLKINCQWSERGGTNTDLIKSVVEAITGHPEKFEGEIIIADNGQAQYGPAGHGGSVEWPKSNAADSSQSVRKVADGFAKEHKVSAMIWDPMTGKEVMDYSAGDYEDGFVLGDEDASTGIRVSYPKFRTQYGTYVSFKDGIWSKEHQEYSKDRLKVINMPVLKSHMNYNVTASIKSYMGTTSDKLTNHRAHISVGSGGMGVQMAETRMPVLNIIDAIWINPHPGRGPYTSYRDAVEANIIAAGTDPAALDYWASRYILAETAKQLGFSNYQSMSPDTEEPGTFGYWLGKSVKELNERGFKTTMDEKKINVFVDILR